MDYIALVLGMLTAFALGAYIRQPFELKPRKSPEIKPQAVSEHDELSESEFKAQERRMQQLMDAWNYNGKPTYERGDD